MKNRKWFLVLLFVVLAAASPRFAATAISSEIHYAPVEGVINPVVAEFISDSISGAEAAKAEALIIQLDTPGGLDLSMRDIIKHIFSSDVPVVVYVAPAGSRAASAGVFITYAANIAAMAPGTNIGSAHPVAMGGGQMDETMMKKVENDAVAYIKSIAAKRKRNAAWAEKAVRESVNITADEALKLNIIDIVADSREDLIKKLDGRKVELASGERVIKTKGAKVVEVEMSWRSRVLQAITNPNVAYILMVIGIMGLYFELSNPGAVLPGVIGAICLVLAFYAFQSLSVNYAGLLLIALALIFFIAEVKVVSYGLLTVAGIVSLILGSLMLFNSPAPFMRLSVWVLLPSVLLMTAFVVGTMYYAVRLHRRRPVSGAEGLVGEAGRAAGNIAAGSEGKVFVDGEYWNAVSDEEIRDGEEIRVTAVEGLHLKVARKERAG
ncbi:MAG TPA: nodulation protein NfeD [Thermodesulfobacteriota bacterium]|nr:nodulation protein NfeD [Thermodesulfobacteriota bacterium]